MENKRSEKNIKKIIKLLEDMWPNAKCELDYNTPFQLLIAVILSAQTTDKSVNKALKPLLEKYPAFGPQDLVALGRENFFQYIKSIGLAPTKSKNCLLTAQILCDKFAGQVPSRREDLESLPGVGRKTANVVLNVAFGKPTLAVDTHVARVSQRLGLVPPTANPLHIEKRLLEVLPPDSQGSFHHKLIFHGRYHCLARSPKCGICPLLSLCPRTGVEQKGIDKFNKEI